MEIKYDHPLLHVNEKIVAEVRNYCGKDEQWLREATEAVLDWCRKEEHLKAAVPYLAKTRVIERRLILSKGSIEDCKKRVDALLTSRGMMPEICINRTVEEIIAIQKHLTYVTLPKLLPSDLSRCIIIQFKENLDDFTFMEYCRYAFYIGEYRLYDDYCLSERYIIDMKNVNFGILAKINPMLMKKSEILATEGYGTKVKGIHLLNAPSFVDKFVFILKQALKPKVASRLHVHNSLEDFYQHIPKSVLPKDYGGEQKSCEELTVEWNKLMSTEESKEKIKNLDYIVADETKRTTCKFNEEYLGMPGSFRRLAVD